MKKVSALGFRRSSRDGPTVLGVSEAVGTVLLLGISMLMVGGVALWTAQFEGTEEGLYVDLWSSVEGSRLKVIHRGGDPLYGPDTEIVVRNSDGSIALRERYYDPGQGRTDEYWGASEEVTFDISSASQNFKLVVTTIKDNGISTVVLSNDMIKGTDPSGSPDLAVTRIRFADPTGALVTSLFETGKYQVLIEVTNFGADIDTVYFSANPDMTVNNLVVYDSENDLVVTGIKFRHYDGSGVPVDPSDTANWGKLKNGERMVINLTWDNPPLRSSSRTLGLHELGVKVISYPAGEVDYRNNVVKRKFQVEKKVLPIVPIGPDPGIYDIYFSNDNPKSGEQVTVTVVVQNSGSMPLLPEMDVNLVVSLDEMVKREIDDVPYIDWVQDYPGHEGLWRMDDSSQPLVEDELFPTCVVLDLEILPGSYQFFYFSFQARVDIPGGEQWVYAGIDVYNDDTTYESLTFEQGDYINDNLYRTFIQVLPRILLVDDDGAVSGTPLDMTTHVVESLVGAGIQVDTIFVAQVIEDTNGLRDAPAYTYTKDPIPYPAMEDYDIVVWVTGHANDPLTNVPEGSPLPYSGNIQQLREFMDNNGYLLIIGKNPYKGLGQYFTPDGVVNSPAVIWEGTEDYSDAREFLYNYMGIAVLSDGHDLPVGTDPYLVGLDTDEDGITPVEEGEDYTIVLKEQVLGNGAMSFFTPRTIVENKDGSPFFDIPKEVLTTREEIDLPGPRVNILRSWSFPPYENGPQFRAVTLGWDISQVKYLNEKIGITAGIMRWFDWEIKVGRDLAVTKMEMYILKKDDTDIWYRSQITTANVPKYLDTVEIEVTVRNNGPSEESPTLIFYVTGPNGIELQVTSNIPDPRGDDDQIPPGRTADRNPLDVPSISGSGGETTQYKLWLALGAGLYTFRVEVDPYHLITEVNEENNDISYSTTTLASFVAENNILIVDDDGSENNFHTEDVPKGQVQNLIIEYEDGEEPSQVIEDVLIDLEYDYEVFTTTTYDDGTKWVLGDGPEYNELKRFNSVIWVTGEAGRIPALQRETLTDADMLNIMKYLNGLYDEAEFLPPDHNENMMFIGSYILTDITDSGSTVVTDGTLSTTTHDFLREYLGVEPDDTTPLKSSTNAYGKPSGRFSDHAYLGLDLRRSDLIDLDPFGYAPLTLSGWADSETNWELVTVPAPDVVDIVSVQQHRMTDDGDNSNYFRTVLHSWEPTKLVHSSIDPGVAEFPLHELMFLGLHWFETPDDDPELVSRDTLISFSDQHPEIGKSYVVRLKVANLGGVPGGGTVRFLDTGTIFKSEYIFLDPGDEITLEALWEPQYAGTREITVWLDRFDDWDEVFDSINNIPSKRIQVYYLWDDMESGSGEWEHDANLIYINGESPLDYYDPTGIDPDTNVISDWDMSMSFGLNQTKEEFHSSPSSFQLRESTGIVEEVADVLISFVIDDSASMTERKSISGDTWLKVAQDSAKVLLDQLSNDSVVVSIWDFQGNLERRFSGPTDRGTSEGGIPTKVRRDPIRMGDDFGGLNGREYIRKEIDKMSNPGGTTILWDSIGEAYLDTLYWSTYYPDLEPVVVVLSDGMDLQASDKSGLSILTADAKIEAGSSYWAPWGDMTMGEQYYPYHVGKYTLDWSRPLLSTYWMYALATGSVDRYRYGLLYSDIPIYTVGLGVEHHDPPYLPETFTNPLSGPGDHKADNVNAVCWGKDCLESGTLEYNLWRIADTSDAEYFYAPSADELEDIFKQIGQLLAKPQAQSRSGVPTRQESDPNTNKWAVTPAVDLSDSVSSRLTFWHKYNTIDGANGAYILVGYRDPAVDTDGDGNASNDWDWRYATPGEGFYSGSLMPNVERTDSFGTPITWGWTGISGEGTFGWEHVEVNVLDFVPEGYRSAVRVRFQYTQYGGGTGLGWFVDDVRLTTSRSNRVAVDINDIDTWRLIEGSISEGTTHSGTGSWFCGGWNDGDFHEGIDNSLYTRAIDLTTARTATLEFMAKFNLQKAEDQPPDGFRVEISKNGGLSWTPLNFGLRASWGVSGTESDASDGTDGDGKSFTGLDEGGSWVSASSLTRMTVNLNGYSGEVVMLRFRMITNTDGLHAEDISESAFFGLYIDDIVVFGESQAGTRGVESPQPPADITPTDQALEIEFADVNIGKETGQVQDVVEIPDTVMSEEISPEPAKDKLFVAPLLFVSALMIAVLAVRSIAQSKRRRN
ncbi:MAG: CARDB domain-containing protein [Thermoplasmatota archaeon]